MDKFLMLKVQSLKLKVQSLKLKVQSVQKNVRRLYIFPFSFIFIYSIILRQLVLKPGSLRLWKTMELEICFLALQELWTFSVLGK